MMTSFGLTDKGRYRAENQDAYDVAEISDGILAVVCDGMGGAAAGRLASEMAVKRFIAFARAGFAMGGAGPDEDVLRQAADAANREIFHYTAEEPECSGMGTTLVGAVFREDSVTFVNVGDSRAYRIARDGIVQITKDHSLVQQMVDAGAITREEARRHPRRNIITRAVGSEAFVTSDLFTLPLREGDIFLLCTDGLTGAVPDAELHRVALASSDAESACRALVETALQNNTRDNVTAVVVVREKGDANG